MKTIKKSSKIKSSKKFKLMNYRNAIILTIFSSFFSIMAVDFVIIVPSYNNEKYCFRNLDSIINQKTNATFRVLYIDDNSTDATGLLVDAYVYHNDLKS